MKSNPLKGRQGQECVPSMFVIYFTSLFFFSVFILRKESNSENVLKTYKIIYILGLNGTMLFKEIISNTANKTLITLLEQY